MKSGCLINILTSFECSITEDVFNETVVQGMERLYEDAYGINKLIEQSKLKVEKIIDNKYAKKILADKTFGDGECSTLHLFLNSGAKAIITDDRAFLNFLDKSKIPFIIPTDLIVRLYELKVISKDKSTALRQFMYKGAQDYVLELYNNGRISLSKAAQLLDTSTFEIVMLAHEQILTSGATESQQKKSRGTAQELSV